MKKIWNKKAILLVALLISIAALVNPVAAQEPAPDLEGSLDPLGSWAIHIGEVWELPPDAADLMIAPPEGVSQVTIELETKTIVVTGDTSVPANDPDIRKRRIKAMSGDIWVWTTAGEYEIKGWSPKGNIAVVKTGPLGAAGPPPPKNITPEPPTPTPVPPEPTTTPEVRERYIVPSFNISEAGHLLMTMGQETTDLGLVRGVPGQPGTIPSADEVLAGLNFSVHEGHLWLNEQDLGEIQGKAIEIDLNALKTEVKNDIKSDQAFVDSLRPPEAVTITPLGVVTDVAAHLATKYGEQLRGEPGPPGPGVADWFIYVCLATTVIAVVGVSLALYGLGSAREIHGDIHGWVSDEIRDIKEAVEEWTEALSDRATSANLTDLKNQVTAAFRLHDEGFKESEAQFAQLEQGLQIRPTRESLIPLEEAVQALQVEFNSAANVITQRFQALEAEIAPLRPQLVTFDNAGKPRCPGCKAFAKRIPAGVAGRCTKCGVAYMIPIVEETIVEEVAAEAAAEAAD